MITLLNAKQMLEYMFAASANVIITFLNTVLNFMCFVYLMLYLANFKTW